MNGLTLSRKQGEYVQLTLPSGELIYVSVEKIKGEQVKLKFHAHESIKIARSELIDRKLS